MTNHGDDCYFYYYSTCAKGDSCPFRHCEAARGNETICNLWQEGRCYRMVCKFRHMEIKKNRKEIPCYWENQPAGCQKPHCAFYHERPRFIDGVYVPASKGLPKNEEPPHEEPALPPPAPLPTAANPQLRGVIMAETQEKVPSPTHPPVVINPADDDEDEDDQFSEEGEDSKVGPDGNRLISPRKLPGGPSSGDSLNFGVSTLEEIRLRKALKASMNRTGYPVQSAETPILRNNGEKENIRSLVRPALFIARDDPVIFEDTVRLRGSVAERLGKNIFKNDTQAGADPPLKRRLAERLGRVVDEEKIELASQTAVKPVRERLGLPAEHVDAPEPVEINSELKKAPGRIRIKTLEEIRREKAAKAPSLSQKDGPPASASAIAITNAISSKPTKGSKRAITVKASSISQVKTFSEILRAKNKRLEEEEEEEEEEEVQQQKASSPKRTKQAAGESPGKTQDSTDTSIPSGVAPPRAELKIKTLEEIRREKAARMQAQQGQEADSSKSPASSSEDSTPKKPRLLRINKPTSPAASNTTQRTAELTEKTVKPTTTTAAEPSSDSSNGVKVKTFEEIMQEKRLRKQQMEEQASSSSQSEDSTEAEPAQKPAAGPSLKRKVPIRAMVTAPAAAPPSSTTPASTEASTQAPKAPISQRISLRTKAALPVNSTTTDIPFTASTSPKQVSPPRQAEADSASCSPTGSTVSPGKRKRNSPGLTPPAKQAKGAVSPGPSVKEPPVDMAQKKSPGQTTEPKVRPKLNVKPSVMKPAAQVKPGQKRKAAERSAVAAIKPLNSTPTVEEEPPLQELPCKPKMSPPSSSTEAQVNAAVPRSPPTLLGSGSSASPLGEELQTVPVAQHSLVQTPPAVTTTVPPAAASETSVVPQSPVMKTPTLSITRRPSLAASRAPPAVSTAAAAATTPSSTMAVDDFDELMNEFTGDHLEEDMDPSMGEEDLLQELSEMIDS